MGPSGASLGRSWAFFGRFLGLRNEAFIKHWSKMVSKRPSGSILEGFGEGSGRIWGGSWEDFGRVLGGFMTKWLTLQFYFDHMHKSF